MVLDHVLVAAMRLGAPEGLSVIRLTATRLSLPAFVVVSGVLWGRGHLPSLRRSCQLVMTGAAMTAVTVPTLGVAAPDVLVVLGLVALVGPAVVRWPLASVVLGLWAAQWLPVPWDGYQPGLVAGWAGIGVLASARRVALPGHLEVLLERAGVVAIGRRALRAYVVHLVGLSVVVALFAG